MRTDAIGVNADFVPKGKTELKTCLGARDILTDGVGFLRYDLIAAAKMFRAPLQVA